jgi:hypothetical protein
MSHERLSKPFLESTFFGRLTSHYARFERPISSASLVGGFAFDALTLKRVDTFWENFWVVVHLVLVAACILLISRAENRGVESKNPAKIHFWLINASQFLFGGLLSTFLVFYFRSGSLWVSWPFFLILAAAFVANEKLKQRYARLDFQLSLFYLSLFCFTIFILPVVLHAMGPVVFLLSGALSVAFLLLLVRLLKSVSGEKFPRGMTSLAVSIGAIFVTINMLYFLNLIPPIPLSLQDASVHHAIVRNADGNYAVQSEDPGVLRFFRFRDTFHAMSGEPVYAYSAVFSPTSLNTQIIHEWQFYDKRHGWTTMSRIELPVKGGRGGGYRTYSRKTGVVAGAWRVNVKAGNGALLGRLRFNVILQSSDPPLINQLKY